MTSKRRCRMPSCSRSTRRTMSSGSTMPARSGDIRDQLLDPALELHRPDHAHLETEVAQGGSQVVRDGDGLRLQQFAMGQQHPQLLATYRLHMHRTQKVPLASSAPYRGRRCGPSELRGNAARMCRVLEQQIGCKRLRRRAEQPLRQRPSFQSYPLEMVGGDLQYPRRLSGSLGTFTSWTSCPYHQDADRVLARTSS